MYISCMLVGEAKGEHEDIDLGTWYSFEVARTRGKTKDIIRVLYPDNIAEEEKTRIVLGEKYIITGTMEERIYKEGKSNKDLSLIINMIESTDPSTPTQAMVSFVTKKKPTRRVDKLPQKVTFTARIPKLRKSRGTDYFVTNVAGWHRMGDMLEELEDEKPYLFIGRPVRRFFNLHGEQRSLVEISLSQIQEVSDGENQISL